MTATRPEYRRAARRRTCHQAVLPYGVSVVLRLAIVLLVAVAVAAWQATSVQRSTEPRSPGLAGGVSIHEGDEAFVVVNEDGEWTIFKRCRTRRRAGLLLTVGPGYVARFVTAAGTTLVDGERPPGTLNDSSYGGLGVFGWHHARGRPRQTRFGPGNAWEISGRQCAAENDGFGVLRSRVVEEPHTFIDETGEEVVALAVEAELTDGSTSPATPVMRVRYRYRFGRSVVRSWVVASGLCPDGRCGRTRRRAFLKEPKLVTHLGGPDPLPYTRMATFGEDGELACISLAGGSLRGPILETGQCPGSPLQKGELALRRARLRFDFGTATSGAEGGCEASDCFNVVMRAYPVTDGDVEPGGPTARWDGNGESLGLDGWAEAAAGRPPAYPVDTPSIDGVLWDCHGSSPGADGVRRWETIGRKDEAGRFLSMGGIFPGWEGGRGGYDCEPLARTFGPAGESFAVFASYSLGPGWESLR